MNLKEADFESLRDYNDYLEQIEDITWNLILQIDVEATESKLRRWDEHRKAAANPNARRREMEQAAATDHRKGATQQRKNVPTVSTAQQTANEMNEDVGFKFHGLRKRITPPPEAPFDPFGGWSIAPQYYTLQDDYEVDWLTAQKNDTVHTVGGYDMKDFYDRSLREAFGGFCVFLDDELSARNNPSLDAGIATQKAASVAAGGTDVNMDDVF